MTDKDTALSKPPQQESDMSRIRSYMLSPEVKERFSEMMGPNAIYYLNQVLILVANSEDLQKCSLKSIFVSAMRAASLKLSVDSSSGQAWIIPYKGVATFQVGYKGVYELAQRTNLYRFINMIDIYEGESIEEDRMTGMHKISGQRKSINSPVWARMLYFQLVNGFEKTFMMTCEEIEAHAKRYSPGYNSSRSKWHDPHERAKMERKTVMVNGLRKWGRFNQGDMDILDQIEGEQGQVVEPSEESQVIPQGVNGNQVQATEKPAQPSTEATPQPAPKSGNGQQPAAPAAPAQAAGVSRPYSPVVLKEKLTALATGKYAAATESNQNQRNLLRYGLELLFAGDPASEAKRHQVLAYLTGTQSSKECSSAWVKTLLDVWLKPVKGQDGDYQVDAMAVREAQAVVAAEMMDKGQLILAGLDPETEAEIPAEFR